MKYLKAFILSQRVMALASHNEDVWITNIYYGTDENLNIFFISPLDTKHSQQILQNPQVAFSLYWHAEKSFAIRAGVQGIGICNLVEDKTEIALGISLHNKNYPEFAERITEEWINTPENKSKVWKITPKKIKYWDDELYGEEKAKEFNF